MKRLAHRALGKTGLELPPIIFGTSTLGNLYEALPDETKLAVVSEMFQCCPSPVVLDSAGKYGAGLALEVIGDSLRKLGIHRSRVLLSNKLGWYRVPLRGAEPTFEPGVWASIEHDAQLRISYEGILQCWQQGCQLLGGDYVPQMVSVHDPDEYLAAAIDASKRSRRLHDVIEAYRALFELRAAGEVKAVGVGAKDWRVIREIAEQVDLDWVMLAVSLTVCSHPPELLRFIASLVNRGVGVINSAVFHGGFLTGGGWFNYRKLDPSKDAKIFAWRERFFAICRQFEVKPAAACVQFGLSVPGVTAVALSSSNPARIRENVASLQAEVPPAFWRQMKSEGLIARDFPYLS
jgi:D-threo-aldose 1-dehydrogenase